MRWCDVPTRGDSPLDIVAVWSGAYDVRVKRDTPSDHAMLIMTFDVNWNIEKFERSAKIEDKVEATTKRTGDYVSNHAKTVIAEATQDTKAKWYKPRGKGEPELKNFKGNEKYRAILEFIKMKFGMDGRYTAYKQMTRVRMSSYISGTMRYEAPNGKKMSETIRHYSYNKAMGPDRVTEEGMRRRDKRELKQVKDFITGRSQLRDLRTDLVVLPKKEEEVHVNEHRPIAIMTHRTKAKDHAFIKTWYNSLRKSVGLYQKGFKP